MSQKPQVVYFPMPGRAFTVRAALRHANVDFDLVNVSPKKFMTQYKKDPKLAPLGSLPVLVLPEGTFVQSTVLARWAGRKSDLYPTDEIEQLIVDEVMESANEMISKVGLDRDSATRKEQQEKFVKNTLPLFMNLFTSRIERSGGPFVLGKKMTVADMFLYSILTTIYAGITEFIPKDIIEKNYPIVHKLYISVEDHPISRAEFRSNAKL